MIQIRIDDKIRSVCPEMRIGLLHARVTNAPTGDALWQEMLRAENDIKARYELLAINERPAIAGTRKLYKALGKDPSRYRVSSEALCRRIVRGLGLYRTTTLIDAVNLVSVISGYAISGLDADKIVGDTLSMGVGEPDEIYHGIGRGELNIAGMPVYRDAQGAIATPTSDEERTKFEPSTTHVQICINAFAPEMPMEEALQLMRRLLIDYADATEIETNIFQP